MITSLYLGTGKPERELVSINTKLHEIVSDTLQIDALHSACRNNSNLRVDILFDFLRATRGAPKSSFSMLSTLMTEFPGRVSVYGFHTPQLKGLVKKLLPPRINEVVAVSHLKAYVFDDSLVISGYALQSR